MKRLTLICLSLLLFLTASAELSEKKMLSDVKAINKVLYSAPDKCKKIDKPVCDIIWNGNKDQRKWLAKRLLEVDVNSLNLESQSKFLSWAQMLIKYQCFESPFFIKISNGRTYAERDKAMRENFYYDFYPNHVTNDKLLQAFSLLNEIQTFIDLDSGADDSYLASIQGELIGLRTLFLEKTLYGTTTYAESRYPGIQQDQSAQRIAQKLGYSDFINDPRRLAPYITSLSESYNDDIWSIYPDLFAYDFCHLSFFDIALINSRIRTIANAKGQGHEMEENLLALFQNLAPTIYQANTSRFTAMQANNDNYETLVRFIEFRQSMQAQGKEFVNYQPLYCPYELQDDSLFEQYKDLYLRSGMAQLREMSFDAGGMKSYVHNPSNVATIKDILVGYGYDLSEMTWDNAFVYYVADMALLALNTYYSTKQVWLIGDCMMATGIMTQLYDEWYNPYLIFAMAGMFPIFEITGNSEYAKNLIESYCVPELQQYLKRKRQTNDMECFDAETASRVLPYLTQFEDNRYAELAEKVKDKLIKVAQKEICDNVNIIPCIADYYYHLDSEEAIPYFDAYLALTQDTVYTYLNYVGLYGGGLKQYEKAVPYANWLSAHHPTLMIESYSFDGMAVPRIYTKAGYYNEAIQQLRHFEHFLRNEMGIMLLSVGEDQSAQLIELYGHVDDRYLLLLTDTLPDELHHEFAKSFYNWELLSKGLLLALNKEKENLLLNHPSPYIRQQYHQLQIIRKKLSEQANINSTEAQVLQADRDVAQNNLQHAVQAYIDEHGFEGVNIIEWQEIRQALHPNEVAIEFVSGKLNDDTIPTYYALLLRHNSEQPVPVRLFREDSIQRFIRNKRETQIYNDSEVNKTVAQMILNPLRDYVREGETVYFAATGVLHQIALENMYLDDEHLVSDIYQMRRLSSTRQLVRAQDEQRMSQTDSVVLYGGIRYDAEEQEMLTYSNLYPGQKTASRDINETDVDRGSVSFLSGTLEEVNRIDTMLSDSRQAHTVLKDMEANEESFKALSGTNTALLHVATHGFFWKQESAMLKTYTSGGVSEEQLLRQMDPLRRCGLLLAGANKALSGHAAELPQGVQDGVLTGQEIALLDLNKTKIAILSACKTGVGEVTGDGVFGLQRAFKKAGVETLIMSLWKVNDAATQLLMTEFYYNWIILHQSKREAFRNAQNTVRAEYEEPVYWAGFIMLD